MTPEEGSSSPQDLAKTARLAAVWSLGSKGGLRLVNFATSVVLARLLTPADFGVMAAARFFITLATRMSQFGLGYALVRQKELDETHASTVFVANLALGILSFGILIFASPYLGAFVNNDAVSTVLPVSAFVFLISPLRTVATVMLTRQMRYRASVAVKMTTTIVAALASVALALAGFGYWSLVLGTLVGSVTATLTTLSLSPFRPSLRFSLKAFREIAPFGLGIQTKRLIEFGGSNLDSLLVGRFLGVTNLGFYDKGYGLMTQLTDRMAFDGVLLRAFSVINDDPGRLRYALRKAVQAVTLVSFPGLVLLAVTADPAIVTVFGPQWDLAVGPFRVMAVAGMFRMAARPVVTASESLGWVWKQSGQQVLVLIALVVGVTVGSRWGLTEAAGGVLLAAIVHALANARLITRTTTVTAGDLASACAPALAMSATVAIAIVGTNIGLSSLGITSNIALLLCQALVALACYGGLLLWTPFSSVASLVRDSVDDVAPWLPQWARIGALRTPPTGDITSNHD